MTKLSLSLFAAAFVLLVTAPSFAAPAAKPHISGCVNSPENPTAILAAVGSASAVWVSRRRR